MQGQYKVFLALEKEVLLNESKIQLHMRTLAKYIRKSRVDTWSIIIDRIRLY